MFSVRHSGEGVRGARARGAFHLGKGGVCWDFSQVKCGLWKIEKKKKLTIVLHWNENFGGVIN